MNWPTADMMASVCPPGADYRYEVLRKQTVTVQDDGKRRLRVSVSLPRAAQAAAPAVELALAAYLFETTVSLT